MTAPPCGPSGRLWPRTGLLDRLSVGQFDVVKPTRRWDSIKNHRGAGVPRVRHARRASIGPSISFWAVSVRWVMY